MLVYEKPERWLPLIAFYMLVYGKPESWLPLVAFYMLVYEKTERKLSLQSQYFVYINCAAFKFLNDHGISRLLIYKF